MSMDKISCKDLKHPFQNEPGTSQSQRVMEDLLSGTARIDGRSMADLLDYFVQLSRHINYYDKNLGIKDWQPFFHKSLPFIIANIIRYDRGQAEQKIAVYRKNFDRKPTAAGLQLLIQYCFNRIIAPVNNWQVQLQNSGLPLEPALDKLISSKLREHLRKFIALSNTAVNRYGIKSPDFSALAGNPVWDLDVTDLYAYEAAPAGNTKRKRLIALRNKVEGIVPMLLDAIRSISGPAELSMEQSFFPLKEELQEKHSPHLAIIFTFLKLFRYLQNDLNSYTKKHLDFFYKQVLRLQPHAATPDKVHIVFSIQDQLDQYLLKKGLLLKGGKDSNKAEMLFATDDEIVVNKTQVADTRTLFLNNKIIGDNSYLEGVYMAPSATKADGVDKEFKTEPSSWSTLGAALSKYTDPENKFIRPYPNARLGFLMASPVLLLQEGKRTVNVTLDCALSNDICASLLPAAPGRDRCCDGITSGGGQENNNEIQVGPYNPADLCQRVQEILNRKWYYISRPLIAQAVKKGISKDLAERLSGLLSARKPTCYCPTDEYRYETVIIDSVKNALWGEKEGFEDMFGTEELATLAEFFSPRKALNLLFSGEKEWISPALESSVSVDCGTSSLSIRIKAVLAPDQPAVTFYDAATLKEETGTTLPLLKVELDDRIKMLVATEEEDDSDNCCLRAPEYPEQPLSLYHFFRNLIINTARIEVEVCGVRNLLVQNDENVENVNSLVRPFSIRPKIGANFYIGSKEILSKKWDDMWVNVEWKDRPKDFTEHYKHYNYEPFEDGTQTIKEDSFKLKTAMLENGVWENGPNGELFNDLDVNPPFPCTRPVIPADEAHLHNTYHLNSGTFNPAPYFPPVLDKTPLLPYNINSRYGLLRFTLGGVSFQHDRYTFIVARHMIALAGLVDPISMSEVLLSLSNAQKVAAAIHARIVQIENLVNAVNTGTTDIDENINLPGTLLTLVSNLDTRLTNAFNKLDQPGPNVAGAKADITQARNIRDSIEARINNIQAANSGNQADIQVILAQINNDPGNIDYNNLSPVGLHKLSHLLTDLLDAIASKLKASEDMKGLPKEPYTPQIKTLSIDYTATALAADISFTHLYPFANTYKKEELQQRPALFPTHCDEGTLFIGLKGLEPGSNLHLLFQLAEATADSESERQDIRWSYLDNNQWKTLRRGFEVLDDATDGLTVSGIVKLALPENMTSDNTVLPKGLHWIKVAISSNSRSVSETIAIHTQAVRATFANSVANDQLRLSAPLTAGSVGRLQEADASVKQVLQPFDSFGGRMPEEEGSYYVRASELLRHKGRAIQKFDYERLALEAFPQLFKVKCINHSFTLNAHRYINDYPLAPGYVTLALIPDLNQLKAVRQFEPRVPVSLLEQVENYMRQRTSPFVRFRAVNPRYEKVDFCLRVKFYPGKDEKYYQEKLAEDLREFLAPWAVGVYDKLSFGQCIHRSDIIRFLEDLDYLDYVLELNMRHEEDRNEKDETEKMKIWMDSTVDSVCPITPRSILIAGDINICIPASDCADWDYKNPCRNEPVLIKDYCADSIKPQ